MTITQLDPTLLAELKRLEIKTRRKIDATLSGTYRSAFKGSGLVFSEVREYQPGDDVKHLHWKVTARTGIPHVKSFEEDRHLSVVVLVDFSASMLAGAERSRYSRAVEFGALISLLAKQNGDAYGLMLCNNEVETNLPPSRRRRQYQLAMAELLGHRTPTGTTSLNNGFELLLRTLKRNSVIFVCSDFHDDDYHKTLGLLSVKHDVIGVYFEDEPLSEIPPVGLIRTRDPETGSVRMLDLKNLRAQYGNASLETPHLKALERLWRSKGAEVLRINGSPLRALAGFMERRVAHFR